jgi:hypothetical protein
LHAYLGPAAAACDAILDPAEPAALSRLSALGAVAAVTRGRGIEQRGSEAAGSGASGHRLLGPRGAGRVPRVAAQWQMEEALDGGGVLSLSPVPPASSPAPSPAPSASAPAAAATQATLLGDAIEAVCVAAMAGDLMAVQAATERAQALQGYSIDAVGGGCNRTPLYRACLGRNPDVVRWLLAQGERSRRAWRFLTLLVPRALGRART